VRVLSFFVTFACCMRSRLYRRASNRHISRILATVIVVHVWNFVCEVDTMLIVLRERGVSMTSIYLEHSGE
jgi:hypothetical protein